MNRTWLLACTLLTFACQHVHAQPTFSIERMRKDISRLASDEFQGRGVGSRGEELSIDYIASAF